jgi:hypothetical protein
MILFVNLVKIIFFVINIVDYFKIHNFKLTKDLEQENLLERYINIIKIYNILVMRY